MTNKWKSRKWWLAIQAAVVGLVILIWGAIAGETVQLATGAAIEIASLYYLKVEGDIDKERAKKQ